MIFNKLFGDASCHHSRSKYLKKVGERNEYLRAYLSRSLGTGQGEQTLAFFILISILLLALSWSFLTSVVFAPTSWYPQHLYRVSHKLGTNSL